MALRLAGEVYSMVQGLDDQGWVSKTKSLQVLDDKAIRTRQHTAGYVILEGYGSGAHA